jgi:hypothetical protein
VPCSPRKVPDLIAQKAQSWQAPPEPSEEKRLKFRKTYTERLRERSIICKTCGQTYTEAHNSAFACGYHPGVYRVACPVTCPASKDVSKITPACMGHRRKRWSCCDSVFEGKAVGGATGCKYRYHLPPSQEPRYGDVAAQMLQDVVQTEKQLDAQIEESRSNSTVRHAMKLNRDQLALAADRQSKERSIVAKFKELKCDKHMDEHVLVSALQDYETSKAEEEKERMARVAGHEYRNKNLIVYDTKEEVEALPDLTDPDYLRSVLDSVRDEASTALSSSLASPPPTPIPTPSTTTYGLTPSTSAPSTFRRLEDRSTGRSS